MLSGNQQVGFDLSSACNGELNSDFLQEVSNLLLLMKKGEKSSISIKVEVERLANADSLVSVSYSINSKKPDKKVASFASISQVKDQLFLMTDEPVIHVSNVTLFEKAAQ